VIALDTFGGRIHVEWDPSAAVTPLGPLPFFIEFLKVSGLLESWVEDCPRSYPSNNASSKREILATFLLSILAGHQRYAHITALRQDGIHPELLGVKRLVSEDAARRALKHMDEAAGIAWLCVLTSWPATKRPPRTACRVSGRGSIACRRTSAQLASR
jgi:hypothetical protein